MWICQQCGADVQEDWDTCWNCSHVREQGLTEALVTHSEPRSISNGNRSGQCSVCQSTRIIPNLDVRNTGATHSIGQEVEVARHPNAAIFRGAERSSLRAWVCGMCGYTEMYVDDPERLWNTYTEQLQFRGAKEQPNE